MKLAINVLALGGNGQYQHHTQITKFIQALQRHAKGKLSEENAIIITRLCKLHVDIEIEASFFISKPLSEIPTFPGYTGSGSTSTGDSPPSSRPASSSSSPLLVEATHDR